jgi:hypothetical protein
MNEFDPVNETSDTNTHWGNLNTPLNESDCTRRVGKMLFTTNIHQRTHMNYTNDYLTTDNGRNILACLFHGTLVVSQRIRNPSQSGSGELRVMRVPPTDLESRNAVFSSVIVNCVGYYWADALKRVVRLHVSGFSTTTFWTTGASAMPTSVISLYKSASQTRRQVTALQQRYRTLQYSRTETTTNHQ